MSIVATTPRRFSVRGALRWMGLLPPHIAEPGETGDGIPTVLPADLTREQVAQLLVEYRDAKDVLDAAAKQVTTLRAVLGRVPAGIYGPMRLRWGRGREQLDQQTARARLLAAGQQVPTTRTSPVIKVERVAAPETAHAA